MCGVGGEVTQEGRGGKYGKMSCGFFTGHTEMINFQGKKNKKTINFTCLVIPAV